MVIQYTTFYISIYFAAKSSFLGFEKNKFSVRQQIFNFFYPDVVRKEADGHYDSVFQMKLMLSNISISKRILNFSK